MLLSDGNSSGKKLLAQAGDVCGQFVEALAPAPDPCLFSICGAKSTRPSARVCRVSFVLLPSCFSKVTVVKPLSSGLSFRSTASLVKTRRSGWFDLAVDAFAAVIGAVGRTHDDLPRRRLGAHRVCSCDW